MGEAICATLRLIPRDRQAQIVEANVQLNYKTVSNAAFLVLAGALVWRFLNTGGPKMLKMMDSAPAQ